MNEKKKRSVVSLLASILGDYCFHLRWYGTFVVLREERLLTEIQKDDLKNNGFQYRTDIFNGRRVRGWTRDEERNDTE